MGADLGPVGQVDGATWRSYLGLAEAEQPVAVVVEGSWWRAERTCRRLARLEATRELGVPDVHLGTWAGRQIIYACPYGAPRTAEVVHIAARVGVRLAIQIGSCGVVGAGVHPGDVVVPTEAWGADGVTSHYARTARVPSSTPWADRAEMGLKDHEIKVHRGPIVTWPTLFNQPVERVGEWGLEGYIGVDMETATTLAVAGRFGIAAISMLVAWDEVLAGRSFLDPLPPDQAAAFVKADEAVFEVALALVSHGSADG
ncbi:hypothetical protein BH23CHL8_BH23CHL8_13310 [soil metagenome]